MMMTRLMGVVCAALLVVLPVDTPDPSPGFAPPDTNGEAPQVIRLPAVCAQVMIACAFHYDPDRGVWLPNT